MGIVGLWRFLQDKGYQASPQTPYPPYPPDPPVAIYRVDVLGSFYNTIRQAYSTKPMDVAHTILEQAILRRGIPSTSVLYLDGLPSEEKKRTQDDRDRLRSAARVRAVACLETLERLLLEKRRIRKRLFRDVIKYTNTTFYWELSTRQGFAQYMENKGWTVKQCPTEADLAIARDCQPDNIVISTDSDMLAFDSIKTIWRVQKKRFLVYNVPDVLTRLGISRQQLTALCVVSKNDYTSNIAQLGPSINHGIIKTLTGEGKKARTFSFS